MNANSAALLSFLLFLSTQGAAQEVAMDKAAHDFALSKVAGLMYVRSMSQKCPFEKKVAETFDIVSMVVAAGIPKLPEEEIEATSKFVQARVERDLLLAKDESCKKAIAVVQATVEELDALQKRKK